MSTVVFEEGAVSIDAAIVAKGLAIEPALVQPLMHEGKITSLYERGANEDAGRYRLTFFHQKRCLRLVIDATGNIVEQSTFDVGKRKRLKARPELRR
jgi:Family of unknown function (DUF6522)